MKSIYSDESSRRILQSSRVVEPKIDTLPQYTIREVSTLFNRVLGTPKERGMVQFPLPKELKKSGSYHKRIINGAARVLR